MSNSKLTKFQKAERKSMRSELHNAGGWLHSDYGVTLSILPEFAGAKMARVSVSVASEDEQKVRRKVGEYWALHRMMHCEFILVPIQSVIVTAQLNHLCELFSLRPTMTDPA